MHYSHYCRSILFTTALRRDQYAKAQRIGADISLVDMEDSVGPDDKVEARAMAAAFFAMPARGLRRAIRVNCMCSHDGMADLLAVRAYPQKPDVVVIPKAESPRDVEIADKVLGDSSADVALMAVIETARGLLQAEAIARASPRLKALIFGSADYSFSVNSTMEWSALYHARAQLVVAARAAGIHAIDTACFDIQHLDRLLEEATQARNMGFSGKAAIHPSQVEPLNRVFSPDCAALDRARRIVAQAESRKGNICAVDGMMVGAPIVEAARQTLAEFDEAAPELDRADG